MTETQSKYKTNSLSWENQNEELTQGHSNGAASTFIAQLIQSGVLFFEPIASKGTYRVLDGNIECGRIFVTDEGTWKNSASHKIYGTPYQAAAALFETSMKPVSILDKPFDELTSQEWELLKTWDEKPLNVATA
ncbi:MAG: hypothetical protein SAK29_32910 [Scytonema sp. PMC 1069.18]|nr:hypothetical protein [Scytonema sp. PMC 1069.18]